MRLDMAGGGGGILPAMISSRSIAVGTFLSLGVVGGAVGQTVEQVRAWIAAERERSVTMNVLEGFVFKWHREATYVPPAAEISAMRARVEGKPEHPDRHLLGIYEKRLANGPAKEPSAFYYFDKDHWRLNRNIHTQGEGQPTMFLDAAQNDDDGWVALPQSLLVEPAGTEGPSSAKGQLGDANFAFGTLIANPFGMIPKAEVPRLDIRVNGTGWEAVIPPESASVNFAGCRVTGTWDHVKQVGILRTAQWLLRPEHVDMGGKEPLYRFGASVFSNEIGHSVYSRVDTKGWGDEGDGEFREWAWVFNGIERIPPEQREALLRTPKNGESDPIRGTWAFQAVRGGGSLVDSGLGVAPMSTGGSLPSWAGYAMAALIPAVAAGGWYLAKHRRAERGSQATEGSVKP